MSSSQRQQKYYKRLKEDAERYKKYLEKKKTVNRKCYAKKKAEVNSNASLRKITQEAEAKRKRLYRQKVKKIRKDQSSNTPTIGYICKQSLGRALSKVRKALPAVKGRQETVVKHLVREIFPDLNNFCGVRKGKSFTAYKENNQKVESFFRKNEISRIASGKDDVKSVKNAVTKKRELKTIRYMLMTVSEAYQCFCKQYPNVSVSKSTFFNLRPKEVLPISKTPHNVCVCPHHANFTFLVTALNRAIPEFPKTYKKLFEESCCDTLNELCMTGCCYSCFNDIRDFVPLSYDQNEVSFKQWELNENKMRLVTQDSTIDELIDIMQAKFIKFKKHAFIR